MATTSHHSGSPDGAAGSLTIHQDARVYASLLAKGELVEPSLGRGRGAWIQVARGEVEVGGQVLRAGDGAAVEGQERLSIAGRGDGLAELLLFDLA